MSASPSIGPSAVGPGISTIGFIGLGVMGEPMCGHLARRSGIAVLAYDLRAEPLERLAGSGVKAASLAEIAASCDVILLSLPDGKAVAAVVGQLEPHLRAGQCVVDTSTSSVELTRQIGARLTDKGILYADAPVARTREAASRGELSIMVGATQRHFRAYPADPGDDGHGRDPLRSRRLRSGGENPQQHAGVPALRRAGRGDRHRAPQRRAAGGAAADHGDGIGRQFRAAEPRHEGDAAGGVSGAGVLDAIRDQGPVVCAGDGRGGRPRHGGGEADDGAAEAGGWTPGMAISTIRWC